MFALYGEDWITVAKKRKQHTGECGYVAERMNPNANGFKVVIYEASEQSMDVDGQRHIYAEDLA